MYILKPVLCSICLVCIVAFKFFGLYSILVFLQFFSPFYLFNQPCVEGIAKAIEDL